ncbi:MAG: ATP-dependent sacrificial sulfur transferase LarE [Fibrobacter sp.]|nr:ATP-dependent sacrificial sulfur transferase LarE [Fibrobacter sp.]
MGNTKSDQLKEYIGRFSSAVIAFSGGVDSTFLAKVAGDVLNGNVLLVTASSSTYPKRELDGAIAIARQLNLPHRIIDSEELEIAGFADNPSDRCYYCKHELFAKIKELASSENYQAVFEGSNADDLNDFRPGRVAIKELGIGSPLLDVQLTKNEIRELSLVLGLPTAQKASFACLASRFPYGEKITKEKLDRVGEAEEKIYDLGFCQFRVRSHGDLARVEFAVADLDSAWNQRAVIKTICKNAGFTYVAIDLEGYRTGAMNEMLSDHEKQL